METRNGFELWYLFYLYSLVVVNYQDQIEK